MALSILRGPAGAGKSQVIAAERPSVVVDLTGIWAALRAFDRDDDGKFPVRTDNDPALDLAIYLKAAAVRYAAREGLSGIVTTSSSAPEAVERLREQGATAGVQTIDPGREVATERLIGADGSLSDECQKALDRWYRGADARQARAVEGAGERATQAVEAALRR